MSKTKIDLTNQKFGQLTVINSYDKNKGTYWKCLCDCGNTKIVRSYGLRKGTSTHCGCLLSPIKNGQKFESLTVINSYIDKENYSRNKRKYKCLCVCGQYKDVIGSMLITGKITSCGCQNSNYKEREFVKIGTIFNKLKVIEKYINPIEHKRYSRWICLCECGNKKIFSTDSILHKRPISCGCLRKRIQFNQSFEEISGKFISSVKRGAINRNIKYDISTKYIWDIYISQNRKCALSGLDISFKDNTASVDRTDSTKGYETGNIQILHKNLNIMKNSFSQADFINLCKLVTENNKSCSQLII